MRPQFSPPRLLCTPSVSPCFSPDVALGCPGTWRSRVLEGDPGFPLWVWCRVCPRSLQVLAQVGQGLVPHKQSRGGGQPLTLPGICTPTPFLHHLLRAPQERPASKCGASSSTHTQGSLETGAKGRGKTIHDRLTFRPPHRLVTGRANTDQPILKTPSPPRHPLHPPPLMPAGPVRKATGACSAWAVRPGGPTCHPVSQASKAEPSACLLLRCKRK